MVDEMDDADLDAPEGRGEPGEYFHYLKARSLLAERLGASAQEIAIWTWLGEEFNVKPAGGINGYRDPALYAGRPPRFHFEEDVDGTFAYLSHLMACYYRVDDVRDFEPEERYLTFERVVRRFSRFCAESEALALARAKVIAGELESYHPQTGGTAGTKAWGDEQGFPPLDQGIFPLAQVRAIEAEYAGMALSTAPERSGEGYVPLKDLLRGCWDLPMGELPKDQRETVRIAFAPFGWDALTVEQRLNVASQVDYQRDPGRETERAKDWDEAAVDWEYWRKLTTMSANEFIALRHVCDPREVKSKQETFPAGERPSLGQRIADDLRRIAADPAVSRPDRLTLRQWMQWAQKAGLSCPTFMHAHLDADHSSPPPAKAGITPKQFIDKHAQYVDGGKRYLDKWFKGRTRGKGERPGAAAFRIPGAHGQYDEAAMVAALKEAKVYFEMR